MVPEECSIFNFKINYFKLFFPAALSTADGWLISVSTTMWLSFENSPVAFPQCWSILLHEENILLTKMSNVFQFDDCNTKRGNPRYFPINQTRTRIFGFIYLIRLRFNGVNRKLCTIAFHVVFYTKWYYALDSKIK